MTSSSSGRSVASQKINTSGSSSGRSSRRKGPPKVSSPISQGNKCGVSPSSADRSDRGAYVNTSATMKPDNQRDDAETETEVEDYFEDHSILGNRIKKTLYYGGHLPSTPRPSFPLTVFAVNAFTSGTLGTELDTLEFLDLDMASEIGRNACVSPTVVMMALVYLDRLSKSNPKYLSTVKPSELFVVALLVASKFIQDDGEQYGAYNGDWVTPGFDKKRLNKLEMNFLSALDWNVKVDLLEFDVTLSRVEQALSLQQSGQRGWLTYTELHSLTGSFVLRESLWPILYTYIIQVVTIACISYVTLLATLMTSYMLTPELIGFSRTFLVTVADPITPNNPVFLNGQTQPIKSKYFVNTSDPEACHASLLTWLQNDDWWITDTGDDNTLPTSNKTDNRFGELFGGAVGTTFQPLVAIPAESGTLHHRLNHQVTLTRVTIK